MNCYVCLWICTKKNCTIFYLLHNNFCFGCKLFKKNVKECWEIALKSVIWSKTDNNRPTPTCWYYVRTISNWLSLVLLSSMLVVVQPPMLWCCLDRGLSLTEAKPQFTSHNHSIVFSNKPTTTTRGISIRDVEIFLEFIWWYKVGRAKVERQENVGKCFVYWKFCANEWRYRVVHQNQT